MGLKLFLHGVPDTPAMWGPLISELGFGPESHRAPAMPGFVEPAPAGFDCTKEAYVDWYIDEIEAAYEVEGPVDLVGHDWGALITLRAVSLRPDLVRTWTVANALPHPDYKWHRMARLWQTPLIGEMVMRLASTSALSKSLYEQGLPLELAKEEARHWTPSMRRAILKLYRSAKTVGTDWWDDLDKLPETGLVFWGQDDPYVPLWVAETFCAHTNTQLLRQAETGHWSVVQRADALAKALDSHWA